MRAWGRGPKAGYEGREPRVGQPKDPITEIEGLKYRTCFKQGLFHVLITEM